jgi:hypothetical protein
MLIQYFTRPPVVIPQKQNKHYKYKIGDRVRLPLTKAQRLAIGFKWSFNRGKVFNFKSCFCMKIIISYWVKVV